MADALEEALAVAPKAVGRARAAGMPMDAALQRERLDTFLRALERQGVLVHDDAGECYASPLNRR